MKDLEFADALLAAALIKPGLLLQRARDLAAPAHVRLVTGWVSGWIVKHSEA